MWGLNVASGDEMVSRLSTFLNVAFYPLPTVFATPPRHFTPYPKIGQFIRYYYSTTYYALLKEI